MDTNRLYTILAETTAQLRKGEVVKQHQVGKLDVIEVYAMPHEDEAANCEKVDLHFVTIGVDKERAEHHKDELVTILRDYPEPERLAGGPSYIEVGAAIGDQGMALCLFGLGQVLGLWQVITPESLGFSGEEAHQMAGRGLLMISGFPQESTA